jgi:hypothetical protein
MPTTFLRNAKGQCYDHFFADFRQLSPKKWRFFLKKQYMYFYKNSQFFLVKNIFLANFYGKLNLST